jgi:hypothetical protein
VITWENPVAGTYRFVVLAKAVVNGKEVVTTQVVELTIKEKDGGEAKACAKIKGMVAYEGNVNETVSGVVTAWRQEVIKKDNGNPTTTYRPVYRAEIKNGSYVLMLPAGTYKIRVEGSGMMAEWFDNVVELADAKDVVIECDVIKEIDFVVAMRAKPVLVVAEGRVFDEVTNEPVKAVVVFEARGKEITLRKGGEVKSCRAEGDVLSALENEMSGYRPAGHEGLPVFTGAVAGASFKAEKSKTGLSEEGVFEVTVITGRNSKSALALISCSVVGSGIPGI